MSSVTRSTISEGVALRQEQLIVVRGMRCAGCAAAVEARLRAQPGVLRISINFAADAGIAEWDPAQTDFRALQVVVAHLGYRLERLGTGGPDPEEDSSRTQALTEDLQIRLAVALFFGMWSMMPAILLYLAPFGSMEPSYALPLAIASGVFAVPVVAYAGSHFYVVGVRTLLAGTPGLDSLITLAMGAAVALSVANLITGSPQVYFDVPVMLITFQLIARLVDLGARRRAAHAMRGCLLVAPRSVVGKTADGSWERSPADLVVVGQRIRLDAGDDLALDGQVVEGVGHVDRSLLTGEHRPVPVSSGTALHAGCTLLEGTLELTVTAAVGDRRIDLLARAVRGLLSHKPPLQRRADQLARWLLPVAGIAALFAVAVALGLGASPLEAASRGLAVAVITCPCALSLAIPLVVLLGHTNLAARGIIFRDPGALESAAEIDTVIFDKTGTLTTGSPTLLDAVPAADVGEQAMIALAAETLAGSQHPLARALGAPAVATPGGRQSVMGQGTRWFRGASGEVLAGRARWLRDLGIDVPDQRPPGMTLHLAVAGVYLGRLDFAEALRSDARSVVEALQSDGTRVYLLSGDTRAACEEVASALKIPQARVFAQCLPEEKLRLVRELEEAGRCAFVGDGINDSLALVGASLGIAAGQTSAAAGEAAAVQLPGGLGALTDTLAHARRARRLMRQNLTWALVYNAIALPAALAGWVEPVVAAVAMTLSSLCVLGNSVRVRDLRIRDRRSLPQLTCGE